MIAEVHNTYGGRHTYLLRPDAAGTADDIDKRFYVSPFLPMGGTYTMRTPLPGRRLSVVVTLRQGGETPFIATLTGPGRELTARAAVRAVLGIETSRRKQKKLGYVMLAVSLGHARLT